jgi:hypothetical protein
MRAGLDRPGLASRSLGPQRRHGIGGRIPPQRLRGLIVSGMGQGWEAAALPLEVTLDSRLMDRIPAHRRDTQCASRHRFHSSRTCPIRAPNATVARNSVNRLLDWPTCGAHARQLRALAPSESGRRRRRNRRLSKRAAIRASTLATPRTMEEEHAVLRRPSSGCRPEQVGVEWMVIGWRRNDRCPVIRDSLPGCWTRDPDNEISILQRGGGSRLVSWARHAYRWSADSRRPPRWVHGRQSRLL